MDIRIGIRDSGREISFESAQTASEVEAAVAAVLEGGAKVLQLADNKGRLFIVPTEALGYVEIGAEEARRVGFIA
jgi:predicted RNA-binding protein (virulence factor B family)